VHVNANLHHPRGTELAEMSISSQHDSCELHRLRRIRIALDHNDARLRLGGEYERELGIAGERKWTR
jgi:hypothetical protein